mmetsp:Transcript_124039/g.247021  ORF Transcript_124039/g.247021 Transcript_124039/m.247021 type:complete len:229 (-) Transcript_124039:62-748(-)
MPRNGLFHALNNCLTSLCNALTLEKLALCLSLSLHDYNVFFSLCLLDHDKFVCLCFLLRCHSKPAALVDFVHGPLYSLVRLNVNNKHLNDLKAIFLHGRGKALFHLIGNLLLCFKKPIQCHRGNVSPHDVSNVGVNLHVWIAQPIDRFIGLVFENHLLHANLDVHKHIVNCLCLYENPVVGNSHGPLMHDGPGCNPMEARFQNPAKFPQQLMACNFIRSHNRETASHP